MFLLLYVIEVESYSRMIRINRKNNISLFCIPLTEITDQPKIKSSLNVRVLFF